MPSRPFDAMIGNIRRSRELPDRAESQRGLIELLDAANQVFEPVLASRLELTGGDEFKGLFIHGEHALECMRWLTHRCELNLRFGLGRGTLEVGAPGDPPGWLDGPCFHRARKAIDQARRDDHWIEVQTGPDKTRSAPDSLINAALALSGRVREGWTLKQRRYIVMIADGASQKSTAESLGVAASTISQALKSAKWHEVDALETQVTKMLASKEAR